MPTKKQALKELQKVIVPCFGTLSCDDEGKNPLDCPLEPDCANKWLLEKKKKEKHERRIKF